jgi:hypothetical protein
MEEKNSREDLFEVERNRWAQLQHLLGEIPEQRTDEPSLTLEGWSVRDLVWHMACWNDVVTTQLELMRVGSFDDRFDWNTEENNARFLESGHPVTFRQAMIALERSRNHVVSAMQQLDDVPPRALELFSEPAFQHVDDHLPELRRFLGMDEPP